MNTDKQTGRVYLIGAGPGDPDLLTVKAARVLGQCDVVLYDRLVAPGILALARPGAELIYVGKHAGEQEHTQDRIFSLLLEHALAGKTVARLKGGDPLVFGRGAEEWALALEHGIVVEFIPGVTSASAVPGLAGIPITYREVSQSFTVITGHCSQGVHQRWEDYAKVDTLVVLMGVKSREFIAQSLIDAGRDAKQAIAFIERGSTPEQRVVVSDLGSVARGEVEVRNPAVFVIGDVVRLRAKLMGTAGVTDLVAELTDAARM
jgi:uroporphyrin-III C-methyltransferase